MKSMVIGVPREIKSQEARVALLPSAAYQLIQRGHQVLVEKMLASVRAILMSSTSRPAPK